MKRTHARYRTLVPTVIALAIGAVAWTVEARQAVQKPPATMAAEKAGWWVRVNPNTAATHVYWRFGATRRQLSAPMYWERGKSPDGLDGPAAQRMTERVHIAALAMPPAAPASFCVFFADRGVALVEFTRETNLDIDRGQTAEQCVP